MNEGQIRSGRCCADCRRPRRRSSWAGRIGDYLEEGGVAGDTPRHRLPAICSILRCKGAEQRKSVLEPDRPALTKPSSPYRHSLPFADVLSALPFKVFLPSRILKPMAKPMNPTSRSPSWPPAKAPSEVEVPKVLHDSRRKNRCWLTHPPRLPRSSRGPDIFAIISAHEADCSQGSPAYGRELRATGRTARTGMP